MHLSKKHKLMLLFLSTENPLLKRIKALELNKAPSTVQLSNDDVTQYTAIIRQNREHWARGGEISASLSGLPFRHSAAYLDDLRRPAGKSESAWSEEIAALRIAIRAYEIEFNKATIKMYNVAKQIELTTEQCQQAIDTLIYHDRPLLPAVYYPKAPKNKQEIDYPALEVKPFEGQYMAWLRRHDVVDSSQLVLQCPMRVRYLHSGHGGLRFIRCKMNFPIIRPHEHEGISYWEYDGITVIRERSLFFSFEKRSLDRNDYLHLIAGRSNRPTDETFALKGSYLTTGQDAQQSIASGELLLHRLFNDSADALQERSREIMWNEARVLRSEEEFEEATKRWS